MMHLTMHLDKGETTLLKFDHHEADKPYETLILCTDDGSFTLYFPPNGRELFAQAILSNKNEIL